MTSEAWVFAYVLVGIVNFIFIISLRMLIAPAVKRKVGSVIFVASLFDLILWPISLLVLFLSAIYFYRNGIDFIKAMRSPATQSPYESAMQKPRYWMCVVGPTDQLELAPGSDLPMRDAVKQGFADVAGHMPCMVSSGWGLTKDRFEEICEVWNRSDD